MDNPRNQSAEGTPHMTTHSVDVFHPFDAHLSRGEVHNLSEVAGISSVACDPDNGHVEVTYDLKVDRNDPSIVGTQEMAEAICRKLKA